MRKLIVVLLALSLAACQQIWQPGGSVFTAEKNAFSVTVPAGWSFTTRAVPARNVDLMASKEGIFLQRMLIEHHVIKDPLPNSKRTIAAQMTPFEIAEAVVDDLRADRATPQFEVNENIPTVVGGQSGFRLVLQYQNADNLRLTEIRYGALMGDKVYFVRFVAPSRYYFARDRMTFDLAASSFKLNKI